MRVARLLALAAVNSNVKLMGAPSRGVVFHTSVQGCTFVYWKSSTTFLFKSVLPVWPRGS